MRTVALALLATSLCFCVGAARAPTPARLLPALGTLVVLDVPVEESRPAVQQAWAEAQVVLASRLGPPGGGVRSSGQQTSWLQERVAPWIRSQLEAIARLEGTVRQLSAEDPREALFAAVLVAWVYDDVYGQIRAIPPPHSLSASPEAMQAFQEQLAESTSPIAARARAAYGLCVERAYAAPEPMRPWGTYCSQRVAALPEARSRRAAPRAVSLPEECAGSESWFSWPTAPPPDASRPLEVAVLVSSELEARPETLRRLEREVRARLDTLLDVRLVPHGRVEAAYRLRERRRIAPGAPACEVEPALERILARQHPHLAVARISTFCFYVSDDAGPDAPRGCRLRVHFSRPGDSRNRDGLPDELVASLEGDDDDPAAWLAAAPRLGTEESLGGLLGALGRRGPPIRVFVAPEQDPFLRVAETLRGDGPRQAMNACFAERVPDHESRVSSVRLRLGVSATGSVTSADVEPVTPPSFAVDEVVACLEEALGRVRWTCPADGPTTVEATVCLGGRPR